MYDDGQSNSQIYGRCCTGKASLTHQFLTQLMDSFQKESMAFRQAQVPLALSLPILFSLPHYQGHKQSLVEH